MPDFTFKRFDTYPPLGITLSGASGPIDLSTASAVFMIMKSQAAGTVIASMLCASTIATAGYVKHYWNATETAMADTWLAEFEIHWAASNGIQTVPNDSQKQILIETDLENG